MSNYPILAPAHQWRIGYVLLWLLSVPIPILFLIYLMREFA